MVTDPETLAASESFQAPSHLDRVATDDDHRLESAIQREHAAMQTALSEQDLGRARVHARNVRELVAMRRAEVVEAMERDKRISPWDAYEARKREWVREHPNATAGEYTAAIRKICDELGV